MRRSYRRGQSLIEVVVSLAVIVVLAVSLVTMSLITQRTSREARSNSQATKLVQQSIEQMRIFRDRKGFGALFDGDCLVLANTDSSLVENWELKTVPDPDVPECPEKIVLDETTFRRSIEVETDPLNTNKKQVVVTASWTDSAGTQTVTNNTYLVDLCQDEIVPGSPCP